MRIKNSRLLVFKVLLLLAMLIVVGVVTPGCYGRSQPKGWSGVTVANDALFVGSLDGRLVALNKSDGSYLWPADAILGASESKVAIYGTPVAEGDLVYIGGYDGKVYAFDAESGALRWMYPRSGNLEPIVGDLAVFQGKVYFGSNDGRVYTLDAATGDRVWPPFETGDKIWSTPATNGETIYITSFDRKLYALDVATGRKRWEFKAGGALISTPLIYGDTVYIGACDRYVYAVDAADGSLRWRSEVEAGKWFWAKPVVYDDTIYAPNLDGKVYILDAKSGREVASAVDLKSPISSSPVMVDGRVIIASQEGKVYSLDTSSNQVSLPIFDVKEWDDGQEVYAPLGAGDGVIYIHARTSKQDTIYAVDIQAGGTLWPPLSLSTK